MYCCNAFIVGARPEAKTARLPGASGWKRQSGGRFLLNCRPAGVSVVRPCSVGHRVLMALALTQHPVVVQPGLGERHRSHPELVRIAKLQQSVLQQPVNDVGDEPAGNRVAVIVVVALSAC